MTRKTEYDFLDWMSFPSSLKALNDEKGKFVRIDLLREHPVSGGQKVTVELNVKSENASPELNHIAVDTWDGTKWTRNWNHFFPEGTFPWRKVRADGFTREDAKKMTVTVYVGWGPGSSLCTINLDDARIYLNDKIILMEDFTPPLVNLAAGLTPVVAVSAVIGASELQRAGVIP